MEKELIFGQMVRAMMDFGEMESVMVLGDKFMLMAVFMKEIFFKIKNMVMVS